jgi:hypothetical protein
MGVVAAATFFWPYMPDPAMSCVGTGSEKNHAGVLGVLT